MSNVKAVSLGNYHSACITENGDLYTWGDNYDGQLGIGTADYNPHSTNICITDQFSTDAALSTQSQNAASTPLDTPEFTGLAANTVYNIYAMKDPADGLDPGNLMYINQYTTDEKGAINLTYGLKEDAAVKWLAVPMAAIATQEISTAFQPRLSLSAILPKRYTPAEAPT